MEGKAPGAPPGNQASYDEVRAPEPSTEEQRGRQHGAAEGDPRRRWPFGIVRPDRQFAGAESPNLRAIHTSSDGH